MPENKTCSHLGCQNQKFLDISQNEEYCIFHCNKNDWYTENSDKMKEWDDNLVKKFWKEVREKIEKEEKDEDCDSHDFSCFIFPKLENLLITRIPRVKSVYNFDFVAYFFKKPVDFARSKFLDDCTFENATFTKKVDFIEAKFFSTTTFFNTRFDGFTKFSNTTFHGQVDFSKAKFSEEKQTLFDNTQFLANEKNINNDEDKNLSFFLKIKSIKKRIILFLKKSTFKFKEPNAIFENIVFPSPVVFRGCDLSYVSFWESRIHEVNFDECDFGVFYKNETTQQKIIWNEKNLENNFNEKKVSNAKKYEKVESLYRQLKRNFDDKRDFQSAEDFYVGEMEMQKQRIKEEETMSFWSIFFSLKLILVGIFIFLLTKFLMGEWLDIINLFHAPNVNFSSIIIVFLIFGLFVSLYIAFFKTIFESINHSGKRLLLFIYKWVSEYNSNPIRALLVLIISIFVFSGIYFIYATGDLSFWNDAFKYSCTNAIPFISTPENLHLKKGLEWFGYFQKILSAGIILLFGLSLRRKFKR